MFYGEYPHGLDIKNRIIIPAKFRQLLGDNFIMTRSQDKCLAVYTLDAWRKLQDKIMALPRSEEKIRAYIRHIFGGAAECEPDQQGRVLVPQNLRTYAGINKEVVSVGVIERIEIWSKESWDTQTPNDIDTDISVLLREYGV